MAETNPSSSAPSKFPPLFWLVIMFEFFERGAYYGMMSVLSVYFTDQLHFSKESVGQVKAVIQPILYFLPIVAGALADRFGYRRALTVAFSLLGLGYLLASQATDYWPVFMALVVMAVGAGTFKPVISGTIARTTDASNSSMGFGIFYWSINLGAFLFPLILVPWLKSTLGWSSVIMAASICTGAMLIPTLLFYREPVPATPASEEPPKPQRSLVRTVADAFEIIYSPFVLLYGMARRNLLVGGAIVVVVGAFGAWATQAYFAPREQKVVVTSVPVRVKDRLLLVEIKRNQSPEAPFKLAEARPGFKTFLAACTAFTVPCRLSEAWPSLERLTVYRPADVKSQPQALCEALQRAGMVGASPADIDALVAAGERKVTLTLFLSREASTATVEQVDDRGIRVILPASASAASVADSLYASLSSREILAGLDRPALRAALVNLDQRSFFKLFVCLVCVTAFVILGLEKKVKAMPGGARDMACAAFAVGMLAILWLTPDLSLFTRILSSVIYLTLLSLFIIDLDDTTRFRDHFRFLLMIFVYSGFWVLYFQMFDSVLWYVQAYVDASSLDRFVNGVLTSAGITMRWRFDVEHVTVINAGTIIALQLLISRLVKDTPALPTMIGGILCATVGMGILALSTSIWVFIIGVVLFSIGEMTAHPKFISYVGQTAPRERLATYMGYIFLYGVLGSSIGAIVGANLYVHYVDDLNQPRVLWLIFASIGLLTAVGLFVYNVFLGGEKKAATE